MGRFRNGGNAANWRRIGNGGKVAAAIYSGKVAAAAIYGGNAAACGNNVGGGFANSAIGRRSCGNVYSENMARMETMAAIYGDNATERQYL